MKTTTCEVCGREIEGEECADGSTVYPGAMLFVWACDDCCSNEAYRPEGASDVLRLLRGLPRNWSIGWVWWDDVVWFVYDSRHVVRGWGGTPEIAIRDAQGRQKHESIHFANCH